MDSGGALTNLFSKEIFMKTLLINSLLILIYSFSFAQNDSTKIVTTLIGESQEIFVLEEIQKTKSDPIIDSLKERLNSLDKILISLLVNIEANDSIQYHKNYKNFSNAINIINDVNKTYGSLYKDRLAAEAYNILVSVNNPESGDLGFKFTDVVLDIVENQLQDIDDLNDDDKKIFTQGLTNLVQGVSSLINPASMVGSAIQFISGFVPNRVRTALKDPLGEDFIAKFRDEIKGYRIYFATLDSYNGAFNEDLYNLDSKYSNLEDKINQYIENVVVPGGIDLNKTSTAQINQVFDYSNSGVDDFGYASYNESMQIKKVILSLSELKDIVSELNRYYEDYTGIIDRNFKRNIQLLDRAKKLPKAKEANIESLEKKLSVLKDGEGGKDGAGGFIHKFQSNITQISNYISEIE